VDGELPIACSLSADQLGERLADWQSVVGTALSREQIEGGVRIRLPARIDVPALAGLAVAEHECCPFFTFVLTIGAHGVALVITAPDDARPLVDALIGPAPAVGPGEQVVSE
jgi:MerR family transcriptional regulator, copper efflux regulator